MKFVSWNVNGLRAALGKGFADVVAQLDADCFCVQETKLQEGQVSLSLEGYESYWSYAVKKGYSGVAVFSKLKPLNVSEGIGSMDHDMEGRAVTLEFPEFFLVNIYSPNSQEELKRLDFRMQWEDALRDYLLDLDKRKPVIVCGDLNVAHEEIDLKNPKTNRGSAGFSDEEREKLSTLLDAGFVDTFRHLHPDDTDAYSWWSYRFKARERNVGWRIDYFLVSRRLADRILRADIHSSITGSDHCPVSLHIS